MMRSCCLGHALFFAALLALGGCGEGERAASGWFDPDTIPEAYRHSTAALAWPGASRSFQITPAGDFWNGEWNVHVVPSAAGAVADPPQVIAYEERWRPIARWNRRSGPVRWEFEAVALPELGPPGPRLTARDLPAPRDSGLLVSVSVRAVNDGSVPVKARLELAFAAPERAPMFVAFDAPDSIPSPYRWATESGPGTAAGWSSIPAGAGSASKTWSLAPSASRSANFVLPAYPTPARALAQWARTPHARRAAAARRYWNDQARASATFELGDPEVESSLRAALVLLLACRERRGADWVPIASPLHYRDVWLRDGARATHALAVLGRVAEARALARSLAAFQWHEGAFISQRGQLDGTGQALWAFEQALLRPAADDSVGRYADLARHAWKWLEWQRDVGRGTGWRFGAMLPFGDPRDAELVRAQLVGNDAWALAGYRATSRLLRAAGRSAEADTVDTSRLRYLREFTTALARTRSGDVPPSWQEVGRDWGNLAVTYPCGVLPAADPRCVRLAERVWRFSGGPGLASHAHPDSGHSYVGADLGVWALLAGRSADWERVLDATLAWRSASGGAAELFSRVTRDYGTNPPPHGTAAAALVTLVRNAVVFDDADTLMLTLGGRATWWRGARLRGLPTRWGLLDLEFERRRDTVEWRWSPVTAWTSLTVPIGTTLIALETAGLIRASDTRVLAPPGTRSVRVRVAETTRTSR